MNINGQRKGQRRRWRRRRFRHSASASAFGGDTVSRIKAMHAAAVVVVVIVEIR